uniref:SPRY domain-containing protein n=1 Tax=Globisporangium ultimum (strain ATCC 200006 / CBS 805.95 / DAOM BR144) TaxID=431595 RepID=K3X5V6_GLOUD
MFGATSTETKRFFAPPIFAFPEVDVGAEFCDDDDGNSSEDCAELFDMEDFYTMAQDLLLVKFRCFQPELKVDEIAQRFQKEFGITKDPQQLEERFQLLQAPEFRALLVLYLQAITMNKDTQCANDTCAILPDYQALLRSTRTSCETKLFQLIYDEDKLQNEPNEIITVEISGRSFPKYSRKVSKTQLCRCSSVMQQLCSGLDVGARASRHQAFTLQADNTRLEKIHLTDAVASYDSYHVFNHLEQPIFDRLMQFAKDPTLMKRLALLRQQQMESNQIKQDSKQHLHSIFETQHRQRLAKLEQMKAIEFDRIKNQLEKALEDDIQYIRRTHEALLNHERAKMDAKYKEQMTMLHEKIDKMRYETLELQKVCENNGWNNLECDIMQSSLQIELIFGASDYLVRLLILAEDLDAEPLRRALVTYLSEAGKFPQFALRREMTSKMIPDTTVLEILKRCPTKDLRDIESTGNRFIHHELVSREVHTRKIAFGRLLASLSNDKLRQVFLHATSSIEEPSRSTERKQGVLAGQHFDSSTFLDSELSHQVTAAVDFPDVLEQEFARRRDFSCVKMNSQRIEKQVSFSEEDCVLQLEVSHRYCTVLATKERKQGESGKWMYEPTKCATFIPGLSPSQDGKSFGVTWQSDGGLDLGMLHANGQSRSGVPCFRVGDVIGCTINQDDAVPRLRFYLNGDQVLPSPAPPSTASSKTVPTMAQNAGIAVQIPPSCLFPVVSMYSTKKKPQMRVRFNFRGAFRFPIAGFEPYGAPV